MSALRSSLVKSIVDLSSAELRRTSVSDKQWLGISEEQLINEIFTDEFYRKLHNPTESLYSSNDNPFLNYDNSKINENLSSEKVFLRYILQSDKIMPDTMNYLLQDLLNLTYCGEQFSHSLQKRIKLVRRIYVAALRERARFHLKLPDLNYNSIRNTNTNNYDSIPSIIRLSTRMFISTIRFQPDINVQAAAIQSLNQMLPEFPLLSLFNDSDDCVDALQDFLLFIIKEQEEKLEKEEKKEEKLEKKEESKKRSHERMRSRRNASIKRTLIVQMTLDAYETLIGLVITRGSTKGILNTINMLMNSKGIHQYYRINSYLHKLVNYELNLELSGIGISYFGSWSLIWNEDNNFNINISDSSLATNGTFLFLHCSYGLLKIGTGNNGTLKGKIYQSEPNFYPEQKGKLICIQDLLYFRSNCIAPASFIIFTSNLVEIGTIHQDGSGTIKTHNNNNYPLAPEFNFDNLQSGSSELTTIDALQEVNNQCSNNNNNNSPTINCVNNSQIITDGKYIFVISQIFEPICQVDQFIVDKYDVFDKFHHISRIILTHSGENHSSPLDSDIMQFGKFYTNGQYLLILIPKPYATNYGYNSNQQICRKFRLQDGLFIENQLITCDINVCSIVYDFEFNEIWAVNDISKEVGNFPNEGLGPKFLFPSSTPIEIHRISKVEFIDSNSFTCNQVSILLLQLISRLCVLSIPAVNSISYHNCKLKEPFTVEVDPDLFVYLYTILKNTETKIESDPSNIQNYDIISYCLRILRLNFHHLVAYSAEPHQHSLVSNDSILNDISSKLLEKLRILLLRFIHKKYKNNKSQTVIDAQYRVEIESCETLTVGFPVFYASYHQQSQFLLTLFEPNSKNTNEISGTRVLLTYVLDLLINHQNASYLLYPPNDEDFNAEDFLIPIISNLFRIASNLDESSSILSSKESTNKLLNTINGSSEESRAALKLLFCFQKNLLLRVLETKTDIGLAQALVSYCKHIIQQCINLIETAINKVAEKNSPKYLKNYINEDPQCIVIRALLPNLIHALFLFASNVWFAKEILPYISNLVYSFDRINILGEQKLNSGKAKEFKAYSKQFLKGPSQTIESPHPYEPYSEIIKVVTIPGAVFLSLLFDEKCNTASEGDFLQLYSDETMTEPFGEKYYLKNWPKSRIIYPGNKLVFVFRSNYSTGFWGYKCQINSQIPTDDGIGIWSVELERTLCGLGGRIASNLVIGQPLIDIEILHNSFFDSILFKNGIEIKEISSISKSLYSTLIELFPNEFQFEQKELSEHEIFINELCKGNITSDGGLYIESLTLDTSVPFENDGFKSFSSEIKQVKRYLIAVILKHHNIISDILSYAKSLKKGKHGKPVSPKHSRHSPISNYIRHSSNKITNTQIISEELTKLIIKLTNIILQLHQEIQYDEALSQEISLNNNFNIKFDNNNNQSYHYSKICKEMILKLEFLLKFNIISNQNKQYDINNSIISKEILSFLKQPLSINEIKNIFERRCKRAVHRPYGFSNILDQLTKSKYPGMKHEILCFLGKALRGNNRDKTSHYLDHITGTITILINLVRNNFFKLMEHISKYISDSSNSDAVLQILTLDSFTLKFMKEDHDFLYKINIFGNLYKLMIENQPHTQFHDKLKVYELGHREEISQIARNLFYYLGATCVNMSYHNNDINNNYNNIDENNNNSLSNDDNDKKDDSNLPITEWQQSFFNLVISHLSNYVSQQKCKRCSDICNCDIIDAISEPAMSESREIEVEYIMGLLCVVSATPIGKQCLSTPEFVKNLLNFIFCSREQLKLYTMRTLHEILPVISPNIKFGKQSLVSLLLELIGGILVRIIPQQEDLGLEKFTISQIPIIERSTSKISNSMDRTSSKLDLSHPFFDIYLGKEAELPSGWNRTNILNIQKKEFNISQDNRTVTLIGLRKENNDDNKDLNNINISPAFVIANKEISNEYPFHYFEMRIENIGKGGSLFFGLLEKENLQSLDCYAFDKGGSKLRPPCEESYSNEDWYQDDIIGCGWYTRTGEVFFTKNGKALGIAFKNVYGSFYPFVGIGSIGACILVNFGQMPFRFDVEPVIELTFSSKPPSTKTHECLSFVENLILLLRSLFIYPLWNEILENNIIKSMENCINILDLKKRKKKKKDKKFGIMYPHLFACFAVLGSSINRLKIGANVKINESVEIYGGKKAIILSIKDDNIEIALDSKLGETFNIIILKSNLLSVIQSPILYPNNINMSLFDNFIILMKYLLQLDYSLPQNSKYSNLPMLRFTISICSRVLCNWLKNSSDITWLSQLEQLLPILYQFHLQSIPFRETNIKILENLLVIVNNQLFELLYGGLLYDSFKPAAWIQEDESDDIKIGKWYSIPKKGTGSEWTNKMNNTISYIGYVTLIDYNLSLVKLKLYDPEVNKISEWWYSISDLSLCPSTEIKWPFISNGVKLEDSLNTVGIITKSISISYVRKALSYYLGFCNGLNPLKKIHDKLKLLPITDMLNQLTYYILHTPYIESNSFAHAHEYQPYSEFRILQVQFIKTLKREMKDKNIDSNNNNNSNNNTSSSNVSNINVSRKKSIGAVKSGYLLKKSKRFRTWTKLWFIAHENFVYYQRFQTSSSLMGAICLNDVISTESKSPRIFKVITKIKEYTLQVYSQKSLQLWLQIFQRRIQDNNNNNNKIESSSLPMLSNLKSHNKNQLSSVITMEIIKYLNSKVKPLPHIGIESEHPYKRASIKKIIHIPGAEGIIIIFDPLCNIKPFDVLNFYTAGFGKERELIKSYSGKGINIFTPFTTSKNRMWMEFSIDSYGSGSEWGFRFFVFPLRMKVLDNELLYSNNFEFACCLCEWLIHISPVWIPDLYCLDIYNSLLLHLNFNVPIHLRIRVLNILIPIIQRINLFNQSPDLDKLKLLHQEFFILLEQQKYSSIYSEYLQRLFELLVNCYIISCGNTFKYPFNTPSISFNKHINSNINNDIISDISIDEDSYSEITEIEDEDSIIIIDKKLLKNNELYPLWFNKMIITIKAIKQVLNEEFFPIEFIKEACLESRKKTIIQESPHPYPAAARVTAKVIIPNATSLIITFDNKSITEEGVDHLLFSKNEIGASDIGIFSGNFGGKKFEIKGNSFVWSFLSESLSSTNSILWGFRFTVEGKFSNEINEKLNEQVENDIKITLNTKNDWNLSMDYELISIIEQTSEKLSKSTKELTWEDLNIDNLIDIFKLSNESIKQRFVLLKYLNISVYNILPFIDMQYVNDDWSLAFMIGVIRRLLFYDIKNKLFDEVLFSTHCYRVSPCITLDRHVAQSNDIKIRTKECLFLQACKQLNHIDPALLCQRERAFTVKLVGEGAMDVGGPYREALSEFCNDLHSKELGLFIKCPNAQEEIGFNQDKYIPNASACSTQQLLQFEFLGKLIGIALRTKNILELSFPSIIWKSLVYTKLEWSDLEGIDKNCCKYLEIIREIHTTGVTESSFYDLIFENFTTRSSDGRIIELKRGGKSSKVTWENRIEFTTLVEQYRLNEFKKQTDAIGKGIQSIIPSYLLSWYTWQQLERKVCGDTTFDIDLLKRHTIYVSVSPDASHILLFWNVLHEFSLHEKSLFIRFVWGRSQLPSESEFTTPFQLQLFPSDSNNQDDLLPIAHTCFFSLALPKYSSAEIMHKRLVYAITTCREIDTDFVVPEGDFLLQDEDN